MEQRTPTTFEQVKAAMVSILIGSAISLITLLAQYAIHWLNQIPAEAPGALIGMLKYTSWVKQKWNG